MLGRRERAPPSLWLGEACVSSRRENPGVSAFMPPIPLMLLKETDVRNGIFHNSGTEGFAVLEVDMAVAAVIGIHLVPHLQWSYLKFPNLNQVCSH